MLGPVLGLYTLGQLSLIASLQDTEWENEAVQSTFQWPLDQLPSAIGFLPQPHSREGEVEDKP